MKDASRSVNDGSSVQTILSNLGIALLRQLSVLLSRITVKTATLLRAHSLT